LFFLVPLVGTDVLGLQPDLYYLIYFTIAVAWFAVFVSAYAAELRDLWRHNLSLSLAVGAVAGAGLVAWSSVRRAPITRTGGGSGSRSSGVAWSTAASMR
jgi:hypothetical protein